MPDAASPPPFDPRLLDILVCPVTHGRLELDADGRELVSPEAGLAYPIRDGVPVMLPEEARRLDATPDPAA
jgi:uncharacterized protein